MRVLHVIASLPPEGPHGGLQRALLSLGRGLAHHGVEAEVVTTGRAGTGRVMVEGVGVRYFPALPYLPYFTSPAMAAYLRCAVERFDLVHVVGMFTFASTIAPALARSRGIPCVISPSGMMGAAAMEHRRWKKVAHLALVDRRNLARASLLHATSHEEARDLRAALPKARVGVVPNAVVEPPAVGGGRAEERVVFLGRIHPIKGLDVLVEAMSHLTATRPRVELIVAGPDVMGHWPAVAAQIERSRPRPTVRYVGPLGGSAKAELLASASVLALTSRAESFGLVVPEALSHGTPVVVTRGCPWRDVEVEGVGRWVAPEPKCVADALDEVLGWSRPEVVQKAVRFSARFSPPRVAAEMLALYGRAATSE